MLSHRKQQVVRKAEAEVEEAQQVSRKLDPSLLLTIQEVSSMDKKSEGVGDDSEPKMMLRRRGVWCQYSPKSETITLPLNSTTYLPQEKDERGFNDLQQSERRSSYSQSLSRENGTAVWDKATSGDSSSAAEKVEKSNKIFSITASVLVIISIVTLVGFMCMCTCNRALLVSAHYSSYGQNSNSNNNNNNHHQSGNGAARGAKINRQAATSQPVVYPQTTIAARSIHDTEQQQQHQQQQQQQQEAQVGDDRRHNSIDRFDSGEQIRPPLLRQPTTLAPLTNKPQQVSSEKSHNLQVAASQADSYLSPEERDQLLRNQESHYEGKHNNNLDASASDRERYDKPNSWNQPEGGYEGSGSNMKQGRSDSRPLRPEAAASGGNSDADDADYEDEPPESEQKRANLVPEIRRPTGSASYNHQRQLQRQSPAAAAPVSESSGGEESEPSDDYGGANDDVHFSRKSNQADSISSPLKLAASHHQQNRNVQSSYNSKRNSPSGPSYEGRGGSNSNNEGSPEDGPGFGPGPNEAYMADKAESGRPEADEEGLGPAGGGGDPEAASASEEENKLDRRAMNYPPSRSSSHNNNNHHHLPQHHSSNHAMYNNRRQPQVAADNGEGPDSDEGGDSSDESSPASSSSSKTEVKSRMAPNSIFNQRISSVVPKTSASAPAPLSALSPLGSPPTYSLPLPIKPYPNFNARAAPLPTSQPAIPFQRQQQQHVYGQANSRADNLPQLTNHQKVAANVPYNPQNNPSHAGKYFIN